MYLKTAYKKESPKHNKLRTTRDKINGLLLGLEQTEPEDPVVKARWENYTTMLLTMKKDFEDALETCAYEEMED